MSPRRLVAWVEFGPQGYARARVGHTIRVEELNRHVHVYDASELDLGEAGKRA